MTTRRALFAVTAAGLAVPNIAFGQAAARTLRFIPQSNLSNIDPIWSTAVVVRNMLPKAHFATIYAKPAGRPLVDTFITEVSQNTWIYFPWDVELQFSQPIALQKKS